MTNNVRVGIGTFVIQWNKILIGKRKNAHGDGRYGLVWGHLEFWETVETCTIREILEETSLLSETTNVEIIGFTNDIMKEDEKHYITIWSRVKIFTWSVHVQEEDKFETWEWKTWEEIKLLWDKLFLPIQTFIEEFPDFNPAS